MAEIPRYRCHKEVRAVRIRMVTLSPFGGAIVPDDGAIMPIAVTQEWIAKHKPQEGGYFVLYDDGYSSYSPAKAFEEGYTRIE